MAWHKVAQAAEVTAGHPLLVVVGDEEIALYRVNGEIYATSDWCSHAEASLSEGEQRGYLIECPRHGGQFDIRTGQAKHFPAISPIRTYGVKVEDDWVYVDVEGSH